MDILGKSLGRRGCTLYNQTHLSSRQCTEQSIPCRTHIASHCYVRLKRVIFLSARGCLWLFVFFGRMIWVGWNDIQRGEWQCRYGRWRDEFGSGGGGEAQAQDLLKNNQRICLSGIERICVKKEAKAGFF